MIPVLKSIQGSEPLLHRMVFELRYWRGMTYLDRCGATLNKIMSQYPEWILRGANPNPQGTPLVSVGNGASFSFNAQKLDVSLERNAEDPGYTGDDVGKFIDQASDLESIVTLSLSIEENDLSRAGFRLWYVIPTDSVHDAEEWISRTNTFSVGERLAKQFGATERTAFSVTSQDEDFNYRFAITSVEQRMPIKAGNASISFAKREVHESTREFLRTRRKEKRAAKEYAVMFDVDVYTDVIAAFNTADFCKSAYRSAVEKLTCALSQAK